MHTGGIYFDSTQSRLMRVCRIRICSHNRPCNQLCVSVTNSERQHTYHLPVQVISHVCMSILLWRYLSSCLHVFANAVLIYHTILNVVIGRYKQQETLSGTGRSARANTIRVQTKGEKCVPFGCSNVVFGLCQRCN